MTDILFGQSYYLRFDPKLWRAMQPYPPLGTLYAASYMRSRGYSVALFDAMLADSEQEWAAALRRYRPRFAVLFEDNFNYLSKMCLLRMRQAAFTMLEIARQAGSTVIVCGADASDHAGLYLSRGADYVLVGEGELTLGELVDRLSGRTEQPLETILGLAYPQVETDQSKDLGHRGLYNGSKTAPVPVQTPRRPDIVDLDNLPFPAWDLVDIRRYQQSWRERHGYYSMNMVTTRGCPYHCNWCAKPIWGQRYNVRSPENVVAEMAWLQENYAPDHLWFVDDIMGLKPGWLQRFAGLLQEKDVHIPFKCLSRADLLLRPGEVEALRQAGCQIVWIGAESGSQEILDAMEKGTRVAQIYAATRRLHAAGIQAGFFIQFGYPGESRADIERTLRMVRECRPDDIGMSVSYPLPGTKFFEAVKAQLGERQNWIDSQDLAMLYRGPFTTDFYRQLHTVLHKEFRLRKGWSQLASAFSRGNELTQVQGERGTGVLKTPAALVYHALTLPVARWRLNRLARQPHQGLKPSPQALSQEEAARPSPQPER